MTETPDTPATEIILHALLRQLAEYDETYNRAMDDCGRMFQKIQGIKKKIAAIENAGKAAE